MDAANGISELAIELRLGMNLPLLKALPDFGICHSLAVNSPGDNPLESSGPTPGPNVYDDF
jgi:hypothetical protein